MIWRGISMSEFHPWARNCDSESRWQEALGWGWERGLVQGGSRTMRVRYDWSWVWLEL